jgi:hypothetical protein
MSANGTAYVIPENMEKRLQFWLSMDAWQLDEAAQILSGIDPDKTNKPGGSRLLGAVTLFTGLRLPEPPPELAYKVVHGEFQDSLESVDADCRLIDEAEQESREFELRELEAHFKKCADIARLFNAPTTCPTSPKDWIERTLSKNIEIPWLRWAKERDMLPDGLFDLVNRPAEEMQPKAPGHLNHDPQMQQRANEIAVELRRSKKRNPTKDEVSKILASEVGMPEVTAARRIRKQW